MSCSPAAFLKSHFSAMLAFDLSGISKFAIPFLPRFQNITKSARIVRLQVAADRHVSLCLDGASMLIGRYTIAQTRESSFLGIRSCHDVSKCVESLQRSLVGWSCNFVPLPHASSSTIFTAEWFSLDLVWQYLSLRPKQIEGGRKVAFVLR